MFPQGEAKSIVNKAIVYTGHVYTGHLKSYSGAQVASAHGRGGAARRPSHVLYLKRLQNAISLKRNVESITFEGLMFEKLTFEGLTFEELTSEELT